MNGVWAIWAVKRLVVPIGWSASMLFGLRDRMTGPMAEFLVGAAILAGWAVIADWPRKPPTGG